MHLKVNFFSFYYYSLEKMKQFENSEKKKFLILIDNMNMETENIKSINF